MKSVVQEGATIIKAIESAYAKAGSPSKFFIKVLEYPETSFWGLRASKSAKVALFFEEVVEEKTKTWDKVLQQKEYEYLFKEVDVLMPDAKPEDASQAQSGQRRNQGSRPQYRRQHNRFRDRGPRDEQRTESQGQVRTDSRTQTRVNESTDSREGLNANLRNESHSRLQNNARPEMQNDSRSDAPRSPRVPSHNHPVQPKVQAPVQPEGQSGQEVSGDGEQPKKRYNNRRRYFKRRPINKDDNNSNSGQTPTE